MNDTKHDITDKVIAYLDTLPDRAFTGRWGYDTYSKFEAYIDRRRELAMEPVYARQAKAQDKAKQAEKQLEADILKWFKDDLDPGYLKGMRVKFKGTRDDGYRKVYDIVGEQVIGFQFYYRWVRAGKGEIVDQTSTTSNHITNLRQVLVDGKWTPIRKILT